MALGFFTLLKHGEERKSVWKKGAPTWDDSPFPLQTAPSAKSQELSSPSKSLPAPQTAKALFSPNPFDLPWS